MKTNIYIAYFTILIIFFGQLELLVCAEAHLHGHMTALVENEAEGEEKQESASKSFGEYYIENTSFIFISYLLSKKNIPYINHYSFNTIVNPFIPPECLS